MPFLSPPGSSSALSGGICILMAIFSISRKLQFAKLAVSAPPPSLPVTGVWWLPSFPRTRRLSDLCTGYMARNVNSALEPCSDESRPGVSLPFLKPANFLILWFARPAGDTSVHLCTCIQHHPSLPLLSLQWHRSHLSPWLSHNTSHLRASYTWSLPTRTLFSVSSLELEE